MPSKGTTLRNVRVSDDLWERAKVKATERDTTLSEVVREALERFADDD